MVCGRLARTIAWIMFEKGIGTMETLFTLPKPVSHLQSQLILWSQ